MITLDCGCEYPGGRPDFEDRALLAVAFWCPNGHKGLQGWHGTWPDAPTTNRPLAGIAQRKDGEWVILAKGRSPESVARRTGYAWREDRLAWRTGWSVVAVPPEGASASELGYGPVEVTGLDRDGGRGPNWAVLDVKSMTWEAGR